MLVKLAGVKHRRPGWLKSSNVERKKDLCLPIGCLESSNAGQTGWSQATQVRLARVKQRRIDWLELSNAGQTG
eukprot:1160037-Pelagomonas_calceolata.AAC.3